MTFVRLEAKMTNLCCAHNCTSRDVNETMEAGIRFYRIPVKQPIAKHSCWLNTIKRNDFHPNKSHTVICSQNPVGGK